MASTIAPVEFSSETAELIVRAYAVRYGVSGDEMWGTIKCEDPDLDPTIQSGYVLHGKRENSWGLSQINLTYNPDVTKAEAQSPFFSIDYMGSEFSKGHQSKWSCWRKLYGKAVNAP